MGLLDGTVAFTGGARGHGRAHAITSAREGADTILVDIDDQRDTVPYTMTHTMAHEERPHRNRSASGKLKAAAPHIIEPRTG